MEQGNVRQCGYCQNERSWIWNGKKLKDGSKVYIDEDGARWSGRRCPQCERARVHAAVRCDGFERDIIIRQFEEAGYKIVSKTLPLKVEKDGETFTVGIKRACTRDGKVVLENPVDKGPELVALVFESVRICSADQIDRLETNMSYFNN